MENIMGSYQTKKLNSTFFIKIIFIILGFVLVCNADSKRTLEIQNWGPQEKVKTGEIPNKQSDGNAGLWIKTSSTVGLKDLKVYVNDKAITTVVEINLITASIPKELFEQKGNLKITIKDSNNTIEKVVGTLEIFGETVQKNSATLEIQNWGPQEKVKTGEIPNKQLDGNAGLWIKTSSTVGLKDLKVYVNDKAITTVVETNLITASIPKELFEQKGNLKITIKDSNNTIDKSVGILELIK